MTRLSLALRQGAAPFRPVMARLRRPLPLLAVLLLAVVVASALFGPLSGYPVGRDVDPSLANVGPGTAHWLGTDHLGRDVFWRLVLACRSFVGPGALACLVAIVLAVPAGALAGYRGGWLAHTVRYGFTVVASLPRFVLVLLVATIYGNDLAILAVAAGFAYVPTLGEAVFQRVQTLRKQETVLANLAHGHRPAWILTVHLVLAGCGRLVARHTLTLFAFFVVLETTLSYIGGIGVQEPQPSWGNMLVFEWGGESTLNMALPALLVWATVGALGILADVTSEERGRG